MGRLILKQSLFVGLEAKVYETFRSMVGSRYLTAMKTREAGKSTNTPQRVKDLLSNYFSVDGPPDSHRFVDIRYQLLTGAAGTVAAPGSVSVFYILVFRTSLFDGRKGLVNRWDYERFVEATRAEPLIRCDDGFRADELKLRGKRLVCIYDYVDV